MLDLGDSLIVMEQGQIIADGSRDKVLQALRSGKSQKSAPDVAQKAPAPVAKTSDAAPPVSEPKPSVAKAKTASNTDTKPTAPKVAKKPTATNQKKPTVQTRPI